MADHAELYYPLFNVSCALDLDAPPHSRRSSLLSSAVEPAYPSAPSTSQMYPQSDSSSLDTLDLSCLFMDAESFAQPLGDLPYFNQSLPHDSAAASSTPFALAAPIPRPAFSHPYPDYTFPTQDHAGIESFTSGYSTDHYLDAHLERHATGSLPGSLPGSFSGLSSYHGYAPSSFPSPPHSKSHAPASHSALAVALNPRVRTMQACEKCRVRKAKCSGDHPVCQRCGLRGLVCEYAPERKMRGPNKPKPKPPPLSLVDARSPSSSTASSIGPVRSRRGSLIAPPSSASSSRRSGSASGSPQTATSTSSFAILTPPLIQPTSYLSRKRAATMPSQVHTPPYTNPHARHVNVDAHLRPAPHSHASSPLRASFAPDTLAEHGGYEAPMPNAVLYSPSPFYGSYPLPTLSPSNKGEGAPSRADNDTTPRIPVCTTTPETNEPRRTRVRPPPLDFSTINVRSNVFNPAAATSLGLDVGAYYRAVDAELSARGRSSSSSSSSSSSGPPPSSSPFSSASAHEYGTATDTDQRSAFALPSASSVDASDGHGGFLDMRSTPSARPRAVSDAPFPMSVSMPWLASARMDGTIPAGKGGVESGGLRLLRASEEGGVSGYVERGGDGNGDAMDVDMADSLVSGQ
ncbi:hypothetical protein OF83DRAFT_40729 [Amylostereum chailletii]|nr:hypothetical protein OF83DRAFT_40729 [Amylostereum chailletii]